MKMSRTAIKELTAAYRAVLKHAFIAAMGAVMVVGGANAESTVERKFITVSDTLSDENVSGQNFLTAEDPGTAADGNTAFGGYTFIDRNNVELKVANSQYTNNTFDGYGTIFATRKPKNGTTSKLNLENSHFDGNTAKYDGGAIANYAVLTGKNLTFKNNRAYVNQDKSFVTSVEQPIGGGAISMGINGQLDIISGLFDGNTSGYDGGAIATRRTLQPSEKTAAGFANLGNYIKIADSTFVGNQATGLTSDLSNGQYAGGNGGAIANTFATTEISGTTFAKNTAANNGGAIYNHTFINADATGTDTGLGGVMKITDSVFSENSATNGGAIYNTGQLTISDSEFYKNVASGDRAEGGAIYNTGGLTLSNVKFAGNSVNGYSGGAISTNVKNGEKTTISNSEFVGNTASGGADSGAISIANGDVDIKSSKFIGNKADFGGALYAYTGNKHYVAVHIEDSLFSGNIADWDGNASDDGGGAIVNVANANPDSAAAKANPNQYGMWIKNSRFENNKVLNNNPGGGAMFLGSTARTNLDGVLFRGNSSDTVGGAISTRFTNNGNNDNRGVIDIINTVFANNTAKQTGGAFDNYFHNSDTETGNVYIADGAFYGNSAKLGGAVYNHGDADKQGKRGAIRFNSVKFVNNTATEQGGALFNEAGALMALTGNNVFTGNMAGGVANDIHNVGALNITDGITTIDGGITGTGTLTVADGATLNIGTSTVNQDTLHLDGTVGLTIVDANNYGKLLANTYADSAIRGRVSLTVATTGTYKIFNDGVNYNIVDAGAIYDVAQDEFGTGLVIISTKKVEDIAADTGLTNQAANIVAGLANGNGDEINAASLKVQQALRDGDTDYIEGEVAKTNPLDKPVVQSVAQSVQGQVMTIAANRLAGAPAHTSMGRNGGDARPEYGVWAQGMFNRSKFNGQFNGYTRGIAAGFDTQIDKQYTLGLGYAYGHSDVHANDRDTEIDTNSIFAYAQYKPTQWYVNAALNYSMSQYTGSERSVFGVARIKSDYDVNAFGGQVATGYDFASGMTPEVGVRYLHVSQDSYNNGLVNISSDDTDFLTGTAGLKYRFAIENGSAIQWAPELRAAATYDFVSDSAMSTVTIPGAASYIVDGGRLSRFGGEFGIGLTAQYKGLEISLVYDLDLHQDYTSQTGMAKFRYEF